MRNHSTAIRRTLAAVPLCVLTLLASAAHADPLGLYIGAGIGQAQVKLDDFGFDAHHAGWKALVGLRPIPVFGAELEYVDFGHPSTGGIDANVRAAALYGLLYAPLPVPTFDLYAKAGFSRLQTTANSSPCTPPPGGPGLPCGLFRFDRTDTRVAFGAGAQLKVSTLAIRAEYERFSSSLGDPTFWSAALTWSF
jgi:opacity protein-like surface antigen